MINFKRLALTDFKVDIPRLAKKSVLKKAIEEAGECLGGGEWWERVGGRWRERRRGECGSSRPVIAVMVGRKERCGTASTAHLLVDRRQCQTRGLTSGADADSLKIGVPRCWQIEWWEKV